MTQEVKTVKEKQVKPVTQDFIKASELNPDLASKLRVMKVTLRKAVSRKGNETFFIDIPINQRFLKPYLQISASTFNKIVLTLSKKIKSDGTPVIALVDEKGRETRPPYHPTVYYRFVKGSNNNGGEYYSIELIFAKGVSQRYFFGSSDFDELDNIKMLEEDGSVLFNWEYQPEKLEVTSNPVFE